MAKAPSTANSLKSDPKAAPARAKQPRPGPEESAKTLTPKAELTMAGRILRDIRANSADLARRSDRLLRRVS